MSKLLLCNIDGTLTETISGKQFKQNPQDVKVMNGVSEALQYYSSEGWYIVGITAGHKSLPQTIEEMAYNLSLLPQLERIYFCPDMTGKELYFVSQVPRWDTDRVIVRPRQYSPFRKPSPGMIEYCIFYVEPSEVLMVGDRPEDEQAAMNAGVDFCHAEVWRARFSS